MKGSILHKENVKKWLKANMFALTIVPTEAITFVNKRHWELDTRTLRDYLETYDPVEFKDKLLFDSCGKRAIDLLMVLFPDRGMCALAYLWLRDQLPDYNCRDLVFVNLGFECETLATSWEELIFPNGVEKFKEQFFKVVGL